MDGGAGPNGILDWDGLCSESVLFSKHSLIFFMRERLWMLLVLTGTRATDHAVTTTPVSMIRVHPRKASPTQVLHSQPPETASPGRRLRDGLLRATLDSSAEW